MLGMTFFEALMTGLLFAGAVVILVWGFMTDFHFIMPKCKKCGKRQELMEEFVSGLCAHCWYMTYGRGLGLAGTREELHRQGFQSPP